MWRKGSSSKTKSSKKKRNKISSKALKKKSRRKEAKILHSPDSDSVSLSSRSTRSTSSESEYSIRKDKSKKRLRDNSVSSYNDDHSWTSASDSLSTHDDKSYKGRKVLNQSRKKRPQKRYRSPDSSTESRRRKRSRRHHIVKSRNEPLKKNSRKRLSSSSSDSESCFTCDSRSSSSTRDGKRQRSKVMLDKEIKRSRGRESHRVRRKHKVISPSGSSCSKCREHDVSVDQSEEAVVPVNNSRRLKSVIAVVNRPTDDEENRWEKDTQKEEILCDQDDYPSPKSMDSNEGGSKKESDDPSHGTSSKRIVVENVESEVVLLMKSENIGSEGYNADSSRTQEVHTNSSDNKKLTHVSANFPTLDGDKKKDGDGDGLELILRQKALENLRKFQGGLQAARKNKNLDVKNESVNKCTIALNDSAQNESTEPTEPISFLAQETDKRDRTTFPDVKKDSDAEQMATETSKSPAISTGNHTNQATREQSSKEQRGEAKNGSEFEQKTMSVMRGGEMVQVSYKVYIPKRARALARRQLRR